jgi:hypothetical protein
MLADSTIEGQPQPTRYVTGLFDRRLTGPPIAQRARSCRLGGLWVICATTYLRATPAPAASGGDGLAKLQLLRLIDSHQVSRPMAKCRMRPARRHRWLAATRPPSGQVPRLRL